MWKPTLLDNDQDDTCLWYLKLLLSGELMWTLAIKLWHTAKIDVKSYDM